MKLLISCSSRRNKAVDKTASQTYGRQFKFTAFCGLLSSIFLAIIKLTLGTIGHSYTVVADGIESLSDTVVDLTLLLGVQFWSAPPDSNHPYGHRRIETIITAFVGLFLMAAAFVIVYRAIDGIVEGKRTESVEGIAVIAPIIAILLKEFIYRWTISVSRKIKSSALYANAWHHRSDAITSVVALIAVFIAQINPRFYIVDNIGGIICSILIVRVAFGIIKPAMSELSDSGASEKTRKMIEEIALSQPDIKSVHKIRTRKMGSVIFADFHMLVDGNTTVRKGHAVAETLQNTLKSSIPELIDIVVHIEPNE